MTQYTLADYRRQFARRVGGLLQSTSGASSTTSALIDTADPRIYNEIDQDTLYQDAYLLRPAPVNAADKLRFVKQHQSLTGSLFPSAPWTGAPVNGETYELHTIFDPLNELPELLNDALQRCLFPIEVTFVPSSSTQTRFDLSTTVAPWLTDDRWVYGLGVMATSLARSDNEPPHYFGRSYVDNGTVYLQAGPFQTTDTVYLTLLKSYYSDVRATGGALTNAGLAAETDYSTANPLWVATGAMVQAWLDYAGRMGPMAAQGIIKTQEESASWFSRLTYMNLRLPKRTVHPLSHFGPLPTGHY